MCFLLVHCYLFVCPPPRKHFFSLLEMSVYAIDIDITYMSMVYTQLLECWAFIAVLYSMQTDAPQSVRVRLEDKKHLAYIQDYSTWITLEKSSVGTLDQLLRHPACHIQGWTNDLCKSRNLNVYVSPLIDLAFWYFHEKNSKTKRGTARSAATQQFNIYMLG